MSKDIRIVPASGYVNITGDANFRGDSNSSVFFVSGSGELGSGTTTPQSKFHIVHSDTRFLTLQRSGVRSYDVGINSAKTLLITDNNAEADRIALTLSGSVGIGVTNPSSTLHIKTTNDSNKNQGLVIERSANADKGYINYQGGGFQFRATDGDPLVFGNVTAEHVRIMPNGNVGIGYDSPITNLHIATAGRPFTSTVNKTDGDMVGIVVAADTNQNTMNGIWFSSGADNSGTHWSGIAGSRSDYLVDWSTHLAFFTHDKNLSNITKATEKMRIDGDGNVGIGTTAPDAKLNVVSGDQYAARIEHNADATGDFEDVLLIGNISSSDANQVSLGFATTGTDGYHHRASIKALKDPNGNVGGQLAFYTRQHGNANHVARMTMRSDGNIGIGTSSPSARLEVYKSGSTTFDVQGSQGQLFSITDSLEGSLMSVNDITGLPILEVFDNDRVVMGTFNQNTLVVSGSRVGIGTNNPTFKTDIYSTDTSEPLFKVRYANYTLFQGKTDGTIVQAYPSANADLHLKSYGTGGVLRTGLRLNSYSDSYPDLLLQEAGGRVGIGTTAPDFKLDTRISRASGAFLTDGQVYALGLQNTDTTAGNATAMAFGHGGYNYTNFIASVRTGTGANPKGDLAFGGRPADGSTFVERMRIKSDGNVGIGTSTPGALLDIGNGSAARGSYTDLLIGPNGDNAQIELYGADTSFAISHFNDDRLGIFSNSGSWSESRGINILASSGNVGIGKTNPTTPLDVVGEIKSSSNIRSQRLVLRSDAIERWEGNARNSLVVNYFGYNGTFDHFRDFQIYNGKGQRIAYFDGENKRLGLGTAGPSAKLHVVGDSLFDGGVTINQNLTVGGIVTAQEFHTEFVSASIIYQSGSTQFGNSADDIHEFTGKVGINTGTPETALHVIGDVGAGTAYNGGYYASANASDVDQNWGFDFSRTPGVDDYSVRAKFYPNASTARKLGFYDSRNSTWMAYFDGGVDSNPNFIFSTEGDVGIGTSSPNVKLDIVDNTAKGGGVDEAVLRLRSTDQYGASIHISGSSNWRLISTGGSSTPGGGDFGFYNDAGSSYRMVLQGDGKVGIGTTGIHHKLHVDGIVASSRAASTTALNGRFLVYWDNNNPTTRYLYGMDLGYNGTYRTRIFSPASYDIALSTAPDTSMGTQADYTDHVVVKGGTGKVGIGSTSPNQILDIAESIDPTIRLTSTSTSVNGGAETSIGRIEWYGSSTAGNGAGLKAAIDTVSTSTTRRDFGIILKTGTNLGGSEPIERFRVSANGRIGINLPGVSSPGAILDISHPDGTTNIIRVSSGSGAYRWRVDQFFDMYMTNGSSVDTAVFKNDGSLGLGITTSLGAKLHVNGASIIADGNTAIDPDVSDYSVVAGAINDGGGWGVNSGIGGRAAGAGDTWAIGHNGSSLYFGIGDGANANSLDTFLRADTDGTIALTQYGAGYLQSDANGNITVDNSTFLTSADLSGYVEVAGDTMTGTLNIDKGSSTNHLVLKHGTGYNNVYAGNFLGELYLSTNYYYQSAQNNDDGSLRSMEMNMGTDHINFNSMPAGSPGSRTTVLRISGSQNRVGIATTLPSATLDVNGTLYVGNNATLAGDTINLVNENAGNNNINIGKRYDAGTFFNFNRGGNTDVQFGVDSGENFLIKYNNTGLGSSTGLYSNGVKVAEFMANYDYRHYTGSIGIVQSDGDYLARLYQSAADGFMELYTGEATPVSRVKLNSYGDSYIAPSTSEGALGVGTKTPTTMLDVEGGPMTNTTAKFGSARAIYIINSAAHIGFNTYYDTAWKFGVGSSNDYAGDIYFSENNNYFTINNSTAAGDAEDTRAQRNLVRIVGDGAETSWGHLEIGLNNGWGNGANYYPTIGSTGTNKSLVMLDNPHTPYRTDNAANVAFTGRSGLRMIGTDEEIWDAGVASDGTDNFYHIYHGPAGEFLRVTSAGNVGIGTDAPGYKLDVNGSGGFNDILNLTGGQPRFQLVESDRTDENFEILVSGGILYFRTANDAFDSLSNKLSLAQNGTLRLHAYGSGLLKTNASGVVSVDTSTYLTAESDTLQTVTTRGNTTNQRLRLSNSQPIYFENPGSGTYNKSVWYQSAGGSVFELARKTESVSGDIIDFAIGARGGGYTPFFITGSTGNVGIGTTKPEAQLEIYQSGSTAFDVQGSQGQLFSVTDSLVGSLMSVNDITGLPILEVFDTDKVVMGSFNQNTLVVTGSRVGIGTDSPETKLHIHETEEKDAILRISHGDSQYDSVLQLEGETDISNEGFEIWYDNNVGDVHLATTYNDNAAAIRFHTKTAASKSTSNERMTITGAGDVGIGTNSPDSFFQVNTNPHYDYVHDTHQKIAAFNPTVAGNGTHAAVNIGTGYYGTSGTENLYLQFLNTHGNYGYPVGWRLKSYTNLGTTDLASSFAIQQVRRGNSTSANDGTQPHIDTEFLINEDGNVGVGYTAPKVKLTAALNSPDGTLSAGGSVVDIYGIAAADRDDDGSRDLLRLHRNNLESFTKGTTFAIGLSYYENPGNNYPRTRVDFKTTGRTTDDADVAQTVMSLNDNKRVGIGTTSPADRLHVNMGNMRITNASPILYFYDTDVVDLRHRILGGGNAGLEYSADIGNVATGYHRWDISNAEKMRLIENGNLGIGTDTPAQKLEVIGGAKIGNGTATSDYNFPFTVANDNNRTDAYAGTALFRDNRAYDSANNGGGIVFGGLHNSSNGIAWWGAIKTAKNNATDGDYGAHMKFFTRANGSSPSEKMRIQSDGNIGIGTSTATALLQLRKSVGTAEMLTLSNTSDGGAVQIGFQQQDDAEGMHHRAYIKAYKDPKGDIGGQLRFIVREDGTANQLTSMVLRSDGKVGVGTDNPGYKFEVSGTANVTGILTNATYQVTPRELGSSMVGNFGQWQDHSTYTSFATEPAFWGWNFIQGATGAPNQNSSQWYRNRVSLGDAYGKGTASGDYWMEFTIPRYGYTNSAFPNFFMRTCESGTVGNWGGLIAESALTATTATSANTVDVNPQTTGTGYRVTFVDQSGTGTEQLYVHDSGIEYDPGDKTLKLGGDVIAYWSFSDRRLKENINPYKGGLEAVKQLEPVTYEWKDDREGEEIGFIAQDVEEVLPQVVREKKRMDEGSFKSVDYEKLTAVLVDAVKEQQKQIDELKEEIKKLKG